MYKKKPNKVRTQDYSLKRTWTIGVWLSKVWLKNENLSTKRLPVSAPPDSKGLGHTWTWGLGINTWVGYRCSTSYYSIITGVGFFLLWPLTLSMPIYSNFQINGALGETYKKISTFIVAKMAAKILEKHTFFAVNVSTCKSWLEELREYSG